MNAQTKFGFALIYTKTNNQIELSTVFHSAEHLRRMGRIAVQNSHRSNVQSFEILPVRNGSENKAKTQEILKNRGVSNWWQF